MRENDSFIRPEEFWQRVGVRAGQTVVHLGCGAGFYLIPVAHVVSSKGKAIGVDVLSDILSEVESRAQREGMGDIVQTVRANIENHEGSTLESNSAHWVLLTNILHQSDPRKILAEAARIAASEGHVIVVEWDVHASPFGPPDDIRISQEEVVEMAASVGLKKDRRLTPSPYHYGLVFSITG